MGKIDVSGNLIARLGIGFVALFILILVGGIIIAVSNDLEGEEGLLLSLSHATRIDTDDLTDSPAVTKATYLILAFAGEVLAFYVFYVLIEFLISGQINKVSGAAAMRKIKGMKGHHIICGGGRVGQHLGEKLKADGKHVVFIENDETAVRRLRAEGYKVYGGDALDENTLQSVGVKSADSLAAVLGNDGDNLLLILAAKEHNSKVLVASRANDELIVSKLKHAGAEIVILPEVIGGIKLAEAILGNVDEGHVIHHPRKKKPHAHKPKKHK